MSSAIAVLQRAVAADLVDVDAADIAGPSGVAVTKEVIGLAAANRVLGLLWQAVERGHASGSAEDIDLARTAVTSALRTCLIAEETAILAIDALTRAGVEHRAMKGVAIAHLDHADPSTRTFGDADLLVNAQQYVDAVRALDGAGFRRAEPAHRLFWERRFGKSIVMLAPHGAELDLHLRITGGYFGERIDHDRLWAESPAEFTLAGRQIAALDRADRLLNACAHAVLGGGSGLRALHDVALLAMSSSDWMMTAERAEADRVDLVVARGIRSAWTQLSLAREHPAAQWAFAHAEAPDQLRALAAYSTAARVHRTAEDRGVLDALSPVDKLRYLTALALPPRDNLAHRRRTYRAHLAGGWRVMRGAGRR